MSPTNEFDPEDGIVPIDPNYSVVDPVYYLTGVLRREWDTHRTDSISPTIDFSEVQKNLKFNPTPGGPTEDYITVYTTSVTRQAVTLGYGFVNEQHNFTLECTTSGDRTHALRFFEEAVRIIMNHRKDTLGRIDTKVTGRQWVDFPQKVSPLDKISKQMYRKTADGVYHQRYKRIHSDSPDT